MLYNLEITSKISHVSMLRFLIKAVSKLKDYIVSSYSFKKRILIAYEDFFILFFVDV